MNHVTKKILNIALKVVTWLLVAFTVFMMVFTIVTVTTVDRNDRDIFGIKFYIVRTDSMKLGENNADLDVHFASGDIVIIKNVKDFSSLQPGDIIAFVSTNSDNYGETVTHMIREVVIEDGRLQGYVTFGTNTGDNDEALVEPSYVLGQYAGKLPQVGTFFAYVKSTPGYILCILIPFVLLILYNGSNAVRLFRRYKREQMEAMQSEREKLDQERAETQRMMQELLALKAQLGAQGSETAPPVTPASEEGNSVQEQTKTDSADVQAEATLEESTDYKTDEQ